MKKLGIYYEMEKCIGCGACSIACQDAHALEPNEYFRRVDFVETNSGTHAFSLSCNHCHNPACVKVCPGNAMYIDEDKGLVLHNDGLCIGCGRCLWACPYGSVSFSSSKGTAQKCDRCINRISQGKPPACVGACVTHALHFEEVETSAKKPFLPDEKITEPALHIADGEEIRIGEGQ